MALKDSLELGRIGAPYGIKGWVHVQSFTNPPEKLLKYRSWSLSARGKESTHEVVEGRVQGNGVVARLEGFEDRDRAALLHGSVISVARSVLPKLRKREFYQADLVGLGVANLEGVALGRISHFVETPGGDVMVVRSEAGQEHWVPATKEHLSKVDLAAGAVVVDWPAALE
jgi:16S rRNA processing protein RimM